MPRSTRHSAVAGPRPVDAQPAGLPDPAAGSRRGSFARLDAGLLVVAGVSVLGVLLALALEGGTLWQVLQPAAAVIVLGGTCSAVLVQFPLVTVRGALGGLGDLLRRPAGAEAEPMQDLLRHAAKARRTGLVSLDADLDRVADPFMRRCLTLAVDGATAHELEEVMDRECARLEDDEDETVRVWEAAGGFAPTMGILGAVLGLIHVMQQLENMHQVGQGIAVAFVATLYGVGSANLVFLPVAGRLRLRMQARQRGRGAVLDAVLMIVNGASPRMLRERMGTGAGSPRAAAERAG